MELGRPQVVQNDRYLILMMDGYSQSRLNLETGLSDFCYIRKSEEIIRENPHIKTILLGGLGGGTVIRNYNNLPLPPEQMDVVEINPYIITLTTEEFGDPINSYSNVRLFCDDFMKYISYTTDMYDFIFVDCFYHPKNKEVYHELVPKCMKILRDDGILCTNIFKTGDAVPYVENIMNTYSSKSCQIINCSGNALLYIKK